MNQLESQEHQAHGFVIITISKQLVQIHTWVTLLQISSLQVGDNWQTQHWCPLHYSSQWSSNDRILWSMLHTPLIKVKRRFSSEMLIPIWWYFLLPQWMNYFCECAHSCPLYCFLFWTRTIKITSNDARLELAWRNQHGNICFDGRHIYSCSGCNMKVHMTRWHN